MGGHGRERNRASPGFRLEGPRLGEEDIRPPQDDVHPASAPHTSHYCRRCGWRCWRVGRGEQGIRVGPPTHGFTCAAHGHSRLPFHLFSSRGLADAATPVIGSDTDTDGDSASATDGESKPTKTSDRIQAPPTSGLLELDCPNLTGSTHRIDLGDNTYSFKANCGVNHAEGDLTTVVAYSYEDCMIACAAFNHIANIKDTKCVAVHFNAQMRTSKGGNCWLKKKLNDLSVSTSSQANDQMELELLD